MKNNNNSDTQTKVTSGNLDEDNLPVLGACKVKMGFLDKFDPSTFIAPYIAACYDDSLFCDLVFICAGNRSVFCHKMVLCSLSKKLFKICKEVEEAGETSFIHLPDFSYEAVKSTLDEVYSGILEKEVEILMTDVTFALGIEDAKLKSRLIVPSLKLKTEAKEEAVSDHDDDFEGKYFPEVEMPVRCSPVEDETTNESLTVIRYNEYTGTRREFWEEDYVKNIMAVSIERFFSSHSMNEIILFLF